MPLTNTYSFRAECQHDVDVFLAACVAAGVVVAAEAHADAAGLPDVEVEFTTAATLEALRDLMRTVPDGHVMLETLRASSLANNALERDYDLR